MNNLNNIVDYLKVFNNIETYKTPGQRTMAHGGRIGLKPGGIVEPGVEYYGDFKKTPGEKFITVDGVKYRKVVRGPKKNKIVYRGRNPEGDVENEYFDTKQQIKERIEKGKTQNVEKQLKLRKIYDDEVHRVRDHIDDWTENYIKKNSHKYKIRKNADFTKALKKTWAIESKKDIYKLKKGLWTGYGKWTDKSVTQLGFPNFTQLQATSNREPFSFLNLTKAAGLHEQTPDAYDHFFKKAFFADKIKNNSELKSNFNKVFNYVKTDKSKLSKKNFLRAHQNLLTNMDPDVMYMLSDDALVGSSRYDLFSKIFGDTYKDYRKIYKQKINNWHKNVDLIETKLGKKSGSIYNAMLKEQKLLKDVFKVKSLPPIFQYSIDHGMGLGYAASTNNKAIMQEAVNHLIGMTNVQNQALGMGGWEKGRLKLLRQLKKSPNNAQILKDLNAHMKIGYGNIYPDQKTFYKVEGKGRGTKIVPTFKGQNVKDRFTSYIRQISDQPVKSIKETFTDKGARKAILDFKKGNEKTLVKFFKDSGIPCLKGVGGDCTSIADYQKGYNQIVKEAAAGKGSAEAIKKLKGFTKAMRGFAGVAKWTGYGLLAEAGFMVPFAIADYTAGESWKRILGNATDYGFGPIFGQSEQEEFEAALPEGSFAVEGEKAWELSEQLQALDEQKFRPQGRIGMDEARREESRANVITGIEDELKLNLDPFLSDTPWAKDQWHDRMWTQAHEEAAATRAQIEKEKQRRIDERIERGIIADRNWQSQVSRAEGGIMNLKKKW